MIRILKAFLVNDEKNCYQQTIPELENVDVENHYELMKIKKQYKKEKGQIIDFLHTENPCGEIV